MGTVAFDAPLVASTAVVNARSNVDTAARAISTPVWTSQNVHLLRSIVTESILHDRAGDPRRLGNPKQADDDHEVYTGTDARG